MQPKRRNILLKIPAALYGLGVSVRNWLFDRGVLPSVKSDIPVICVGNLQVGGTGKTPHVELLISLLKKEYRLAVLTRGYGRKEKKPVIAGAFDTAETIGDEPLQLFQKFPDVMIYVDGNRRRAIREMEAMPSNIRPEVIIMDDGYQHRYVKPAYSIIVTPFHQPYYTDDLLPYGNLREQAWHSHRADSIVVSHTPTNATPMELRVVLSNLQAFDYQDIYFSRVGYDRIRPLFPNVEVALPTLGSQVVALCGVGDPAPFFQYCRTHYDHLIEYPLQDHQTYTPELLEELFAVEDDEWGASFYITTEKDAVKLRELQEWIPTEVQRRMWVLPITIQLSPESKKRLLHRAHTAIKHNGLDFISAR